MPFLDPSYDRSIAALSVLIAMLASYVAIDLARRVRGGSALAASGWLAGGSVVLGSGIWSMHFVGMVAFSLPIPLGFSASTTFFSWLAAVAASSLALWLGSRGRLGWARGAAGAVVMGGGIGAMHYLGMSALEMAPGIDWDPALVVLSLVIAVAASAAALAIFQTLRRLEGLVSWLGQVVAAALMGCAIAGMHYTGMAAARFPVDSICGQVNGLGGRGIGMVIVVSIVVLLAIVALTGTIDAHLRSQQRGLADSLSAANARLQAANIELQRASLSDPLTGVANRALFEDRLRQAISRVERGRHADAAAGTATASSSLGLLFIDLDGFKAINDSDGHPVGDSVLVEVSRRLRRVVRASDTLARVGSDQFLLLHEEIEDVADAQAVAQRILDSLTEPFALPNRRVTLTCSIGIVTYPEMPTPERLLAAADAAMHVAKRAGGNGHAVFEACMQEDVSVQLDLLEGLREALEHGGLMLHYQPKWDARSTRIVGVEALLRWIHPERGPISPAVFVPIAERFGLIVQMGDWVIDEACRQLARWEREGRQLSMAINLSAYQLRLPDLADRVQSALVRHGVAPHHVICEITETVAMEDTARTQTLLERLTGLGVQLSIDDFGTGYSSLAALRQMRPHELKIDRSFVRDLGVSTGDARAVVDAIVRLAHALGLRVVAEGVETHAQREALVALGCDVLQGFLLGRPAAAESITFEQPVPSLPHEERCAA